MELSDSLVLCVGLKVYLLYLTFNDSFLLMILASESNFCVYKFALLKLIVDITGTFYLLI